MKSLIVLFFTLIISGEQTEIVPKQLIRELKRISGRDDHTYDEIKVDSNLPSDISGGRFLDFHNTHPVKYAYTGRVNTCRAGGCASPDSGFSEGSNEFFDYFILFDSGAHVLSVQVFNYEATHGHEITVRSWLRQFVGYHGTRELLVGKDIDAIAGATISVHSISNDIVDKTNQLKRIIQTVSSGR